MFKEISPVFKTEMVRCSSSSWPCLSTPYRMSSWSSQMRGQFSSEKQTTICIALALISGLKSSQNFHLACWHQPFLEELFTTWLDSLRQNGTSSLYFVSTYYLRFYFFSGDPFLDLQRFIRIRIDSWHHLFWQATCCYFDSSPYHSFHAFRRILRELG